jgi:hypothetical protein
MGIFSGKKLTVRVKYDPRKPQQVEFDDDPQSILDRNPQLHSTA